MISKIVGTHKTNAFSMEQLVHLQLNFSSCIIQKPTSNELGRGQNLRGHHPHHQNNLITSGSSYKREVGWNSKHLSLHCHYLTQIKQHINTFVNMVIEISLFQFLWQQWCLICCTSWSTMFCARSSWAVLGNLIEFALADAWIHGLPWPRIWLMNTNFSPRIDPVDAQASK